MPGFSDLFPTKSLAILLLIGIIDLISTAVLHSKGMIVELNPVMKPLIETSEWLFVGVKGMTLVLAWLLIVRFYEQSPRFAARACAIGCWVYCGIWLVWFIKGA